MQVIPAIDIKDGQCVRLLQGDYAEETVYAKDPSEMARKFESVGAERIHVIDLNGALHGKLVNLDAVKKIIHSIQIPIQLGGGIRSFESIRQLLEIGIDRVIIGTIAFSHPKILERAIQNFSAQKVIVGIDARQSKVAVVGWTEDTDLDEIDLALQVKKMGVERINYTDISKDGMLTGPNIEAIKNMAIKSGLKITASGGVSSIEDIHNLARLELFGVDSVIVGKAIYEKKIDLGTLFPKNR